MPRSCGTCTACCSSLVIEELSKPAFTACAHDCSVGSGGCDAVTKASDKALEDSEKGSGGNSGGGCAIYADRPGSCRSFRCLWLDGHLGDDDRPDQLGVIFTTTFDQQVGTHPLLVEAIPGKAGAPAVEAAIEQLTQKSPVLVLTPAGGTFHPRRGIEATPLTIDGHAA